jgi:hypothetical protein
MPQSRQPKDRSRIVRVLSSLPLHNVTPKSAIYGVNHARSLLDDGTVRETAACLFSPKCKALLCMGYDAPL